MSGSNVRRIARPSGFALGFTDAIAATFPGSRGSSGAIEASSSSSCTARSATSPDARVVRYHATGPCCLCDHWRASVVFP
ncbi:MAG TPA: hypothetical protein VE985_10640 [Gaiellaceae bacterium]|nr:hypothetical protein [Gaiellaceae bacterium]